MKVAHRAIALIGAIILTSTLVACGGAPREVDSDQPDQSQNDQAGDDEISISEINADNVEGMCEQAFGSVEDVFSKLDFNEDFTISEYDDWGDEYFPEDSFNENDPGNATIRCQGSGSYEDEAGKEVNVSLDISITASEEGPRGNTDFTAETNGMTAGMQSHSSSGSGMQEESEEELVDQSSGERFLTDEVLTKFKP